MQLSDLDTIKEIPGFKVILRTILKSQIQHLVEQLASHTGEESVIITASVSEGVLSHLGSEAGKVFIEDYADIKSKFLGFCMKKYQGKSEIETSNKANRQQKGSKRNLTSKSSYLSSSLPQERKVHTISSSGQPFHERGPPTPDNSSFGGIHPVSLIRSANNPAQELPSDLRNEPSSFKPSGNRKRSATKEKSGVHSKDDAESFEDPMFKKAKLSAEAANHDQDISITNTETALTDSHDSFNFATSKVAKLNESLLPVRNTDVSNAASAGRSSCVLHTEEAGSTESKVDSKASTNTDNINNTTSTPNSNDLLQTIKIEPITECEFNPEAAVEPNPTAIKDYKTSHCNQLFQTIKVEAMAESEFNPEITCVGPGLQPISDDRWALDGQTGFGFDDRLTPDGRTGPGFESPAASDLLKKNLPKTKVYDYVVRKIARNRYPCQICGTNFDCPSHLTRHEMIHTGERPYVCDLCGKRYNRRTSLNIHLGTHLNPKKVKKSKKKQNNNIISSAANHDLILTSVLTISPLNSMDPDQTSPFNNMDRDHASPLNNVDPDHASPLNNVDPYQTSPLNNVDPDQISPLNNVDPDQTNPFKKSQ